MTQALLDPSDTGDIPRIRAGEDTELLAPRTMDTLLNLPSVRRPDATDELHVLRPPAPSDTGPLPLMVDVADRQAHGKPEHYIGRHRGVGRAVRPGRVATFARQVAAVIRGAM